MPQIIIVITAILMCLLLGRPAAGLTPTISGTPVSPPAMSGPASTGPLDKEMPGISNKYSPLVFPPIFRAETRVRSVFTKLSGTVRNTSTDFSRSLVGDLGYEDQGIVVEFMARAQASRLSLRAHYDMYLRTYRGTVGTYDWPGFRVGAEVDLVSSASTRFGVDMDFYTSRPSFGPVVTDVGSAIIVGPRPVTAGVYLCYNPADCGTVGWSLEARARRSTRTGTRINELELAVGLKSPEMVLGTVSVRGGIRYTDMSLVSDPFEANVQWLGIFADLVYLY
ncbi:MAG: hypothetical protein AB1646_16430 [Thermodesulfobacteriota bacterium]